MTVAIRLALLCACAFPEAQAQTMEDRARAAAAAVEAKTGSSAQLQNNYVTPGMSGDAIATLDGRTQFRPALACQKTASFLQVLVQPSPTGDIGTISIAQDTDLDGRFDQRRTLSQPISGLCANGVIACTPGSWDRCRYYSWDIDAAKSLKLTQVDMLALAGCYCVNNSCGTNLVWHNLPEVLKDLGGGMVGALTSADPRIGIAQAQVNGPVIEYVGAQTTACAKEQALPPSAYRDTPAAIQADAAAVAAGSSIFQTIKGSAAGTGTAEQSRSCSIERVVTPSAAAYDDIITATGAVASQTSCGPDCRLYRIGGTGSCSNPPATYALRFVAAKPDRVLSARIVDIQTADWAQARVDGVPVAYAGKRPWLTNALPSGDCGVGDNYSAKPNHDFTTALRAGPVLVDARIRATGANKTGYVTIEVRVDTRCQHAERLVDHCAGYATDPACRLSDETVDGVVTFRNAVNTGLRPLPQTRLFGADGCRLSLTRDFFERRRIYRCRSDTASLPTPDLRRGAYIIDHSTDTVLADEMRSASGDVVRTRTPFSLPARPVVPACEPLCKTRKPHVNTAASPAGVTGAQQTVPVGWDTLYHVCKPSNVCPAGPGEDVVAGCGCLDDFPEAAVMMQSVRLAGADMVCTSATP